jgi:hypothetical protein
MLPMFEDRIIHSHLLEGSYESVGIEYFALHAVLPDVALLRKKPFVDELLQASLHCPGSDVHTLRKCRDARKRQSVRVPPEGQQVDEHKQLGRCEIKLVLVLEKHVWEGLPSRDSGLSPFCVGASIRGNKGRETSDNANWYCETFSALAPTTTSTFPPTGAGCSTSGGP